jgi:hypothetical protein
MSAVLQQGLDLLWQQHADAQADRAALRAHSSLSGQVARL